MPTTLLATIALSPGAPSSWSRPLPEAEPIAALTPDGRLFYARHLSIREFGEHGQQALKEARVLV